MNSGHEKFEQIVVVQNPKGSHAKRSQRRIGELQKIYGKSRVHVLKTTANPSVFQKNLQKYLKKINTPTLIGIGGGDGTVHHVLAVLLNDSTLIKKPFTVLPLWGGNANDFGYMLNGLSVNKTMKSLLKRGRITQIHPLEISITANNKTTKYFAICYASFGASAYAANHLDKVSLAKTGPFHNVPLLLMFREALQVGRALLQAPTFKAEIGGKKVEIFEQVFTNGSRIAKINRLPIKLNEKVFYRAVQPNKHPSMIIRLFKIIRGKQVGTISSKPHTFKTSEPALAQFDGEVQKIAAHSSVTVALSKNHIQALTTKL